MGAEGIVWAGAAALPLVMGIVEVAKRSGFPHRYAALLALILGLAGGIGFGFPNPDISPTTAIVQGLLVGLGASGAWDSGKAALQTVRNGRKRNP